MCKVYPHKKRILQEVFEDVPRNWLLGIQTMNEYTLRLSGRSLCLFHVRLASEQAALTKAIYKVIHCVSIFYVTTIGSWYRKSLRDM